MSSQLKTIFFALPIHEIWSNFCFLTFALRRHFFLGWKFFLSTERTFECPAGRTFGWDKCPDILALSPWAQMSPQLKTNVFPLPIHEIWSNFHFMTFALRQHFFFLEIFLSTRRTFECPAGHLDGTNVRSDILTKFDLENNFCPTVPGHVLGRKAKSQVPGTQDVRVRTCQSPQNQSLAVGKQIGTIQVPRTGLARTISTRQPLDLAILLRTWPGTDEQKFFSKSNFVKMSQVGHLNVRTFVPSKCPDICPIQMSGRTF